MAFRNPFLRKRKTEQKRTTPLYSGQYRGGGYYAEDQYVYPASVVAATSLSDQDYSTPSVDLDQSTGFDKADEWKDDANTYGGGAEFKGFDDDVKGGGAEFGSFDDSNNGGGDSFGGGFDSGTKGGGSDFGSYDSGSSSSYDSGSSSYDSGSY